MARTTIGQKAQRVVKFLMGARNPTVVAALGAHGFTEKDLREGLMHLATVTRLRLGSYDVGEQPRLVQELEEFERKWFGIAKLALQHHYPALAAQLFANLTALGGSEAAVAVSTFIERLSALEDPNGAHGADAAAARALLSERGLTAAKLAEGKAIIDQLGTFQAADAAAVSVSTDQEAAERAMWAWYLEWAGIARLAIRDRRVLRALGFLRSKRGGEVDLEPHDPVVTPPVPQPSPAPQTPPALPSGGGNVPLQLPSGVPEHPPAITARAAA